MNVISFICFRINTNYCHAISSKEKYKMPRIDPLQLLKCLSVLLSPEGGILSQEEVPRLVNLMTKFSKKLVSKCVYILILKNTDTSLVDMFMAEGGWTLIQTWLQDAAQSGNWDLVKETLELLLVTPVDVERLKMNSLPKLIKTLSRREDLEGVAHISNQIVQNWLIIVKQSGQTVSSSQSLSVTNVHSDIAAETNNSSTTDTNSVLSSKDVGNEHVSKTMESSSSSNLYKSSSKDDKNNVKKCDEVKIKSDQPEKEKVSADENDYEKMPEEKNVKHNVVKKDSHKSNTDKHKKKSSSSKSKNDSNVKEKSEKSSKDKRDKDKSRTTTGSSRSRSSSKIKESTKDQKKESKNKDHKDKQTSKDKDTLDKIKPHILDKLGRIPKKTDLEKNKSKKDKVDETTKESSDLKKKPSFSIISRKPLGEERTKTVKVFNSKMRSTGLEQEIKPPPPRTAKKATSPVQLPAVSTKRSSPPKEISAVPPEKKFKIDKIDAPHRPGSIKLIPPKPKPAVLQESDIFMDALTASASAKKEPKKRKRRLSATKESSPSSSPARSDCSTSYPSTSSNNTVGITPINFYQDTLNEKSGETETKEENKENSEDKTSPTDCPDVDFPASPSTPTDTVPEELTKTSTSSTGLKGVLLHVKKKGPKRSLQWKSDEDLVEIRYFELDETERINVTRTFTDMAKMEMSSEREALQMSRKVGNEDTMEPQTLWRMPLLCDQPEQLVVSGSKSLEKDIQFAREKSVPQALYFDKRRIPDSSEEPDFENQTMSDPVIIPLEDPDSQEIDLRNTPWPDPKGSPPEIESRIQSMFSTVAPFNTNFNALNSISPSQFQQNIPPRFAMPVSSAPICPQNPGNFGPPIIPPNIMPGPPPMGPPQEILNQGSNIFAQSNEGFGLSDNYSPNFPPGNPGPSGVNMNMFPTNNFNHRMMRGHFRRGGMNNGGWVRMNTSGPSNWKRLGNSGSRGRICKNVQNHGYCRNRDNCNFIHP